MAQTIILLILLIALLSILALRASRKPNIIIGDPFFKEKIKDIPLAIIEAGYVYRDGIETPQIREGIPIIGYRIAPDLVIHDLSGKKRADLFVKAKIFANNNNGELLSEDDAQTLKNSRAVLNKLREDIGEPRLPEGCFWLENGKRAHIADFNESDPWMKSYYNYDLPSIILKR